MAITLAYLKDAAPRADQCGVLGHRRQVALSAVASYFFAQADNKPLWEGCSPRSPPAGDLDDGLHAESGTPSARQYRTRH